MSLSMGFETVGLEGASAMDFEMAAQMSKNLMEAHRDAAKEHVREWSQFLTLGGGGRRLKPRSFELANSIDWRQAGTRVETFSDSSHARIHERGGVTRPHPIIPVRARVLRFVWQGTVVFFKRVSHRGSRMPARPHMWPSLQAALRRIERIYDRAWDKTMAKAVKTSLRFGGAQLVSRGRRASTLASPIGGR